jgi:ligand-binding SRPBCC domain-containing protein
VTQTTPVNGSSLREDSDPPPAVSLFVHRSIVPIRAEELFRWHERPDALRDLTPFRRLMRIEDRASGLHDGGRITFSVPGGRLVNRLVAPLLRPLLTRAFAWRHRRVTESCANGSGAARGDHAP